MTEKTNGSKEFWKGIQANCDHADEALEPDKEKPSTVAPADGQTGKSLENEYPSLF